MGTQVPSLRRIGGKISMRPKQLPSLRIRLASLMVLIMAASGFAHAQTSFIGGLNTVTTVASTVPSNGDVNPYGVAWVPVTSGSLVRGRFLISNFNNSSNQQGTGTTIVEI